MNDLYSKSVMTVIAVALSVVAWNLTFPQPFISPASAEVDNRTFQIYIEAVEYAVKSVATAIDSIAACSQ